MYKNERSSRCYIKMDTHNVFDRRVPSIFRVHLLEVKLAREILIFIVL